VTQYVKEAIAEVRNKTDAVTWNLREMNEGKSLNRSVVGDNFSPEIAARVPSKNETDKRVAWRRQSFGDDIRA
jgi:hypothetical protein